MASCRLLRFSTRRVSFSRLYMFLLCSFFALTLWPYFNFHHIYKRKFVQDLMNPFLQQSSTPNKVFKVLRNSLFVTLVDMHSRTAQWWYKHVWVVSLITINAHMVTALEVGQPTFLHEYRPCSWRALLLHTTVSSEILHAQRKQLLLPCTYILHSRLSYNNLSN